jgi:hypothetical protein
MYNACRFAVYVQHILQKRPQCSEAAARARCPTRGDDGAAPLYAALQLVDGSHGSSAGYRSFGASGGRCCSPRARPSHRPPMSSPPRPLPQHRARHRVASRAHRPPHLAGCGAACARPPALAATPTRLAKPFTMLLALPGCRALPPASPSRPRHCLQRWLPRLAELSVAPPVLPGYRAASPRRPWHRPRALDRLCSAPPPSHPPPRSVPRSAPARLLWWRAAAPSAARLVTWFRKNKRMIEREIGTGVSRAGSIWHYGHRTPE